MTGTRIPQEERTRLMRQRLLEATTQCLVDYGWNGTSTTLVSKRAGVSRGAQLHHFPTKAALVTAAVEYLATRQSEQLAEAVTALPAGDNRIRTVLQMLADYVTSDLFVAALEVWTVARTDPDLLAAVDPLEKMTGRLMHRLTVEILDVDESIPGSLELVQATLDLLRGLGLANTITDDRTRRSRILDRWAEVLDEHLPRRNDASR
ncbi:TetR/AcrR family transcriptional regulator [Dietzia sp. PP-33]|jgi:AcrR family transcriptional regulator|uniref:TetR/AcrR family transcriptional regulator n=1 Tax=Dietzia sp. PP-33 TaxID=2957500 RepID=UPI0029AEB5AE|nr:TetR/AcrR family transcriptional regulator [Dietzia sp. PP-33]MDX2358683.1 TetR/AcrR family transcriptional regulator [Dietzia sp. PP-33]